MKPEQISKKATADIPRSGEAYISEAYNTLRANLLFSDEDIKTVAMVSCTSGEGTTGVTWRLALSLSEIGKNVLVIDGNLRSPSTIARGKGLSDYLSGDCEMEACICCTQYEHLYALPSGEVSDVGENSSKLLFDDRFAFLLKEMREAFDYVLVDCPPLSDRIDGAVAARVCDASAIVLEADRVKPDLFQSVVEQLKKANSRILGVILNKFDVKKYRCYGNYFRKSRGKSSGGQ